ncbi:MAG: hypothetical protein EOP17_08920 [Rhizobiaceae bacterium]|nr:MAG: hypothetical protein EOP17_08920 [Rhizobiaceae bacterium]
MSRSAPRWLRDTEVQLMVTKEINSRTAKEGDRHRLRVNAPVVVDGQVAIPIGASAWAEIVAVSGTSAAGGRGNLSLRLLFVDTAWGRVALSGAHGAEGSSNTGGVVFAVLGFGLLGLFTKGSNATFKAGDIIRGYLAEGESANSPAIVIVPSGS